MKIRVFIERGDDGSFGAYMPDENPLSFGIIGDGKTAEEARQDFLNVFNAYKKDGEEIPANLEFVFSYDTASFLAYYSKKLTLAGLEKITGVAQGQLSHYVNGRRNPSKKTIEKIETALHDFANDLSQVHLV